MSVMSSDWPCPVQETILLPGDVLVIYSDGVTEAPDENDNEYGEQRLVSVMQGNAGLPIRDLLTARVGPLNSCTFACTAVLAYLAD
jgi:serine phosphatase RsbU (regulator of sigma subunit)